MTRRRLTPFLLLATSASASAGELIDLAVDNRPKHSFTPQRRTTAARIPTRSALAGVLSLRGGDSGADVGGGGTSASILNFLPSVEPSVVALVGTSIFAFDAVMLTLSPSAVSSIVNLPREPPRVGSSEKSSLRRVDFLLSRIGAAASSVSVLSYLLLQPTEDASTPPVPRALGAAVLPWILHLSWSILNDAPRGAGCPPRSAWVEWAALLTSTFAARTFFVDAPYRTLVAKVLVGTGLLGGLACSVLPGWVSGSVFEIGGAKKGEVSPSIGRGRSAPTVTTFTIKLLGAYVLALSVLAGAVATGGSGVVRAVGYSWAPLILHEVDVLFLTRDAKELGLAKWVYPTYLIIQVVLIIALFSPWSTK